MEVWTVLITMLGTAMASCVPYSGPHLNESAWGNIPQNVSDQICQDMVPRRCDPATLEYVTPQNTAPPFKIIPFDKKAYSSNILLVSVSVSAGELGFTSVYLQARHGDQPIGQFVRNNDTFTSNCSNGQDNAAVFSSKVPVNNTTIIWVAPDYPVQVQFRATISRSFEEFWVGVTSRNVTVVAKDHVNKVEASATPIPTSTSFHVALSPICTTVIVLASLVAQM